MRVAHRAALPLIPPMHPGGAGGSGTFDPGQHTVADVLAWVEAHPDQAATVAAAEQAGKARSTLLAQLEPKLGE